MYITVGKLMYPKAEEIQIIEEDVIDKNDKQEHKFNVTVSDRIVLSLTQEELETLVDKGSFALRRE